MAGHALLGGIKASGRIAGGCMVAQPDSKSAGMSRAAGRRDMGNYLDRELPRRSQVVCQMQTRPGNAPLLQNARPMQGRRLQIAKTLCCTMRFRIFASCESDAVWAAQCGGNRDWHDCCLRSGRMKRDSTMKGVIFTELIRFLEAQLAAFADDVVRDAQLPNEGAYTSVGTYPSSEALTMVGSAARLSGQSEDELCLLACSATSSSRAFWCSIHTSWPLTARQKLCWAMLAATSMRKSACFIPIYARRRSHPGGTARARS